MTTHCPDSRTEFAKYFNDLEDIDNDMIGGALFGDDSEDPSMFEAICEGLKENEKEVLLN